jgi:glucose-1-phosphate cytidylyltransferase
VTGSLRLQEDADQDGVLGFEEKPAGDGRGNWINAGFFVLEPAVLELIDGDDTIWEFGAVTSAGAAW